MADDKKHVYDESKIKTLSSLEHIRLRTGMYIGRIGDGSHYDDGCYILLKEVIDNGIDEYIMGHGKEIQISIQDKAVSVRDFGRGMSAHDLARVTQPFYRADPARSRATGGLGLGLYLCRRIAEAHGGTLSLASELGAGTEVTVHLPRRPPA